MVLPTLLLLLLILGACNDGKGSAEENDLSGYPETVQNGDVSVEFYEEYKDFITKNEEYSKVANTLLTEEVKFVALMKEYNDYLKELEFYTSTEADDEIHNHLKKVIEGQKLINANLLLLTSSNDSISIETFSESVNEAVQSNSKNKNILKQVTDKYGL